MAAVKKANTKLTKESMQDTDGHGLYEIKRDANILTIHEPPAGARMRFYLHPLLMTDSDSPDAAPPGGPELQQRLAPVELLASGPTNQWTSPAGSGRTGAAA